MNDIIYNITIYQGASYMLDLAYEEDDSTPIDMSGWLVEATVREFAECTDGTDFLCIADASGVHIVLTPAQTKALGYQSGEYDIFITDPDNNVRVKMVSGRANIVPDGAR